VFPENRSPWNPLSKAWKSWIEQFAPRMGRFAKGPTLPISTGAGIQFVVGKARAVNRTVRLPSRGDCGAVSNYIFPIIPCEEAARIWPPTQNACSSRCPLSRLDTLRHCDLWSSSNVAYPYLYPDSKIMVFRKSHHVAESSFCAPPKRFRRGHAQTPHLNRTCANTSTSPHAVLDSPKERRRKLPVFRQAACRLVSV
jgi:hypothetical protein